MESRRLIRVLLKINHEAMNVVFQQSTLAYNLDLSGDYFELPPLQLLDSATRLSLRFDLAQYQCNGSDEEAES